MKHLLALLMLLLFASAYSQSDSLAVKLNHVKQLFIDGTITEQEYKYMRAKILGISTPAPAPIIIQQPGITKQQINSLAVEEQHARGAGVGCLLPAGLFTLFGAVLTGIGYSPASYNPREGLAGACLLPLSVPFWIAGSVETGIANHYKRQINSATSYIRIEVAPTAMRLTF